MTTAISLQELLVALYDSVDGARGFARKRLTTTAFDVTEVTLRFDCELHRHHGRTALRFCKRRLWRTPVSLPLEIRLFGGDTLRTEVRLGDQILKSIAGRPGLTDAASRR